MTTYTIEYLFSKFLRRELLCLQEFENYQTEQEIEDLKNNPNRLVVIE